jgi:hypothetical protein
VEGGGIGSLTVGQRVHLDASPNRACVRSAMRRQMWLTVSSLVCVRVLLACRRCPVLPIDQRVIVEFKVEVPPAQSQYPTTSEMAKELGQVHRPAHGETDRNVPQHNHESELTGLVEHTVGPRVVVEQTRVEQCPLATQGEYYSQITRLTGTG